VDNFHDYLLDEVGASDYASDCGPVWPFGGWVMTVGIGVLCGGGTTAVISSDMRASFRGGISPNDVSGKQWDFDVPYPLMACVAGKLCLCQPLVDELQNYLAKNVPRDQVYAEHIENAINHARARTFARTVDWQMKMAYCMGIKEWQRGKVPHGKMDATVHAELTKFVDGVEFPVEVIVLGFLPDMNIAFFKASRKNIIEQSTSPGIYVIGSGGALAMDHLNARGQGLHSGLPSTLLHISEALEKAKAVSDGSVGEAQALMIIHKDGRMQRLPSAAPVLSEWKTAFRNRTSTASLDGSDAAWNQLKFQLSVYHPRRSGSQKLKGRR
jgi:hypothetical protein